MTEAHTLKIRIFRSKKMRLHQQKDQRNKRNLHCGLLIVTLWGRDLYRPSVVNNLVPVPMFMWAAFFRLKVKTNSPGERCLR